MRKTSYDIAITNDKLTSRKGLLLLAKAMRKLRITELADQLSLPSAWQKPRLFAMRQFKHIWTPPKLQGLNAF